MEQLRVGFIGLGIMGSAMFEFVIKNQKDEEEALWFINKFSIPKDEIYLI